MELYIFRHGLTEQVKQNINYTIENVRTAELLPEGLPAIEKLALYLKNIPTDYNVASPFVRSVKTVEIVENITGKKFVFDNHLGEYVFQEGESFGQMAGRIRDFLNDLEQKHYSSVAVCTHGAIISGLKYLKTKGEFKLPELTDYPLPGVLTIIKDKTVSEIDFNL